jgi:hypothetical protein
MGFQTIFFFGKPNKKFGDTGQDIGLYDNSEAFVVLNYSQ